MNLKTTEARRTLFEIVLKIVVLFAMDVFYLRIARM